MKKTILLILALLIVFSAMPLFASKYYEKGNTFFVLNAGVNFPDFVTFPKAATDKAYSGLKNTHMRVGGAGSLSYQGCISPSFAIGGELGYIFNYAIDKKLVTQVPITARLTWMAVQTGSFDLHTHLNLGFEFLRYSESKKVTPFASLTVNPIFFFSESWGLGLSSGLTLCPEFTKVKENNAIFGESPLTLSVVYRR